MNGIAAVRPELDELKEPPPNPLWPQPMASNAIWHVTLDGANTATNAFDSLTLSSALGYQIGGTGAYSGNLTLLSGPAALPAIEWTAVAPTRHYSPQVTANGLGLYLRSRGATIVVR